MVEINKTNQFLLFTWSIPIKNHVEINDIT